MPNKSDFETLSAAVGGALIAGEALKSKTLWDENGNGTDAFGFSALPAGRYDIGFFGLAGVYTGFGLQMRVMTCSNSPTTFSCIILKRILALVPTRSTLVTRFAVLNRIKNHARG
jgi:uncharacterized protein (TIGR02145 family)